MLTISDTRFDRNCQGIARREFLKIGALGWGGLTLASLLDARAQAASSLRNKSIVLLFLQGGPSQIETFDPKLTAPAEIRSITGEVQTTIPGVTFGGSFGKLAQLADRLSIVRSYASGNAGHTYQRVASGNNPLEATMGAIYARVAGNIHPSLGIPTNTLVLPEAVAPQLKFGSNFETSALPTLTAPGNLGPTYTAFNPVGGGQLRENMELKITPGRLTDRRSLLGLLDRLRRDAEVAGNLAGLDRYQQQAFEIITRGVAQAFDIEQERPETIARYDTSGLFRNSEVQQWFDMRRASNQLGRQLLLARRLCEAGCGFVTVSDCGWDMHSNNNSPKGLGGMNWLGPQVDHAVSAFLEDVRERGLSDDILLIVTGEMGRTPRINKGGGRDHWGNLTPLLFAGGGLQMGKVIGQSNSQAAEAATKRYSPAELLGVVLHTLFDLGELRLRRDVPTEIIKLAETSTPIDGLC